MSTAPRLPPQAWMQSEETRAVMSALTAGGAEARFVGGCVRDALLGRKVKDIDIATPLPPEAVMERLKAARLGVVPTGLAHGTVTAIAHHRPYEITTLRRDVETFGRHARVAFTDDWEADAKRRDLTLNALFCDAAGELWDYVGGLEDLRAGCVRFVGPARQRIEEDYLRLLRFFRFHAHYGRGEPDAEGLEAAAALAPELARISAERKRDELMKLLAAPDPLPVLRVMAARGVLRHVLPETGPRDLDRLARRLALQPQAAVPERLAALLPESAAAAETARRLKLSNEERDRLVFLRDPATGAALLGDRLAFRRALQRWGGEALLSRLALLDHEDAAAVEQARSDAAGWAAGPMPLQGADLVAAGFAPGPALGKLLRQVENWWLLQDRRPDRAACLAKAKELAG